MSHWSIDILRQSSWDLWTWLCLAASGVLLLDLLKNRPWKQAGERIRVLACAVGILGTILVVTLPQLRRPVVGLVWTFLLLSLLSVNFYLTGWRELGGRRIGVLLGLRVLALALLVPMLFEPVIRYVSRPKPETPLVVLLDASGSMSVPDVQNGPTRYQSALQALQPQLDKISDHFVPKFMTFSTGSKPASGPNELSTVQPDGKSTDLAAAVSSVTSTTDRPDTQVVVLSDGIDNASPNLIDAIRATKRPIYTVLVGSDQTVSTAIMNVAVDSVTAEDDFVVGSENKIKATIKTTGMTDRLIEVNLASLDASGKRIGDAVTRTVVTKSAGGDVVELPYKPKSAGAQRLAVWVDPLPGERTAIDNRQEFQGLAIDPRIKVLYVEGRARPEYRELSRALGRDANVEVATLLRIQAERFSASGAVNGEPFKQMPQTREQWAKFDVVILGDLDASFLPKVQQAFIERRCNDGGGLLMIGGQNNFGPGAYAGSPIEQALPVNVGGTNAAQELTPFVPKLTAIGATHPAMEGLAEWFGAAKSDKQLPPLRGNVVVPSAKAGADLLLIHPDRPGPDGSPQIVLAVQRYGEGRSAAFTADTTYLWYLPLQALGQDSPYNRFWGQLVRWLAGQDVRNRERGSGLDALLGKSIYTLGEPVHLRAMVRDERGDATRYAQVSATLRAEGGKPPRQIPLTPSEGRTGLYDMTTSDVEKGNYSTEIVATKDGKELGRKTVAFTVIPPADEMTNLAANRKLMAEIAEATHGSSYSLAELPVLVDELIRSTLHSSRPTFGPAYECGTGRHGGVRIISGLAETL